MKKIIAIMLLLLISCCSLIACNSTPSEPSTPDTPGNPGSSVQQEFTGIVFESKTLNYDGEEHTIVATGIPSGATVTYTNEGPFVKAGQYNITIKVSKEDYKDYTKTVTLKINKIDFPSSISFKSKTELANGNEKSILVEGDLPEGTKITYTNNKATEKGVYNATATLTHENYKTLVLNATLTITGVVNTAKNTVDQILTRPNPWSFMPSAFSKQSLAVSSNPTLDFTSSVNVSSINKKFMGKQMYVLWEGVSGMESFLEKFDVVYALGESIATAYQTFVNDNPDNNAEWATNISGFNVKISLKDSQSKMLAGNSLFSLELLADSNANEYKGRIDIAQSGILNYEMNDNYLKFNIALKIKGVLVMKQIEFVRNSNGAVSGYFYEYAGLKSAAIKTSAVIAFNSDYAVVMSAKRESEDLLINGYEEVYSSKTGQFISAEVLENNMLTDFDTFWVNVSDVTGINSIKLVRNDNTSLNENLHDVYINGSKEVFKPVKNKLAFVETSRKFDIEMKTVYYVVASSEGGKINYEVQEAEIPMVFVQKKNVADFSTDIVKENKETFSTTPALPTAKIQISENNFSSLYEILTAVKEKLTYEELENQLGQKDSFFN